MLTALEVDRHRPLDLFQDLEVFQVRGQLLLSDLFWCVVGVFGLGVIHHPENVAEDVDGQRG